MQSGFVLFMYEKIIAAVWGYWYGVEDIVGKIAGDVACYIGELFGVGNVYGIGVYI